MYTSIPIMKYKFRCFYLPCVQLYNRRKLLLFILHVCRMPGQIYQNNSRFSWHNHISSDPGTCTAVSYTPHSVFIFIIHARVIYILTHISISCFSITYKNEILNFLHFLSAETCRWTLRSLRLTLPSHVSIHLANEQNAFYPRYHKYIHLLHTKLRKYKIYRWIRMCSCLPNPPFQF